MPDDKTTASRPIDTVPVAIIGTADASKIPPGIEAVTEGAHNPNLTIVAVIPPLVAVGVRFVNTYLTTLVGLITAAATTNIIPAHDFYHLVLKCAGLSVASAGIGLMKDLVTVFGRLEGKYPLATGSV